MNFITWICCASCNVFVSRLLCDWWRRALVRESGALGRWKPSRAQSQNVCGFWNLKCCSHFQLIKYEVKQCQTLLCMPSYNCFIKETNICLMCETPCEFSQIIIIDKESCLSELRMLVKIPIICPVKSVWSRRVYFASVCLQAFWNYSVVKLMPAMDQTISHTDTVKISIC